MTRLGGHVTILSQVPAQTLAEFRDNSLQGGARVSLFLFRAVAIGVSIYKYAVRRALLKPVTNQGTAAYQKLPRYQEDRTTREVRSAKY